MAGRFVTEVIREEEQSAASDLLRSQYRADRVAGLQMSVSPSSFSASPMYVPAFVFRSFHFGAKMHTFVSGTAHHFDAALSRLRSWNAILACPMYWASGYGLGSESLQSASSFVKRWRSQRSITETEAAS